MVPRLETFAVPFADMQGLFVGCPGTPVTAVFQDTTDVNLVVRTTPTNDYIWDDADGSDNPFDADIIEVYLSHGSTTPRQVTAIATVS
jgi:hypothetical protein